MEWISVEKEEIPEDKLVIAGLWVNSKYEKSYFEYWLIEFDSERSSVMDNYGEYVSDWDIDDFTHWMPLPSPPAKEE